MRTFASTQDLAAAVGETTGPTPWMQIDQSRVDRFADATEDRQWIHVDPERAALSEPGGTIAHGFLTLSLLPHFLSQLRELENIEHAINYGLGRVRFPAPVPVGARVRALAHVVEVDEVEPGVAQVTNRITIEVDTGEKPACVAALISRYRFRPAVPTQQPFEVVSPCAP